MDKLSDHLKKAHKKFYCPYCLKENKLFLYQMKIYSQSNLSDHIKYGEFDNYNNIFISPPHPTCPFDGKLFTMKNNYFLI